MNSLKAKHSSLIKAEAKRLGFANCGIAEARFLHEEAPHLEQWLSKNFNAQMAYMDNHFDKRLDPRKLVDGAKSVISVLLNYYPQQTQLDAFAPKISKYAYGEDYHYVLKDKLRQLLQFIHQNIGQVNGRAFVDSAPVLDKKWAELSGLGWIGKHSNLLTQQGSFFFIGELILDLPLQYDTPINEMCGSCTRCINACPTNAIVAPKIIDAGKCISYFTIELKNEIPANMQGKFKNWVFGCDICQDVCPYNRSPLPHSEPRLMAHPTLLQMTKTEWLNITEEVFREIFRKSAVKRTKYAGLVRNLKFLYANESPEN